MIRYFSYWPRIFLVINTFLFAGLVHIAHAGYLNLYWGYFGFRYESPSICQYSFAFLIILIPALTLPLWLNRASAIVLSTLFVVVFIPTIVITIGLSESSISQYGFQLAAMAVVMSTCSIMTSVQFRGSGHKIPGKNLSAVFICMFIVSVCILLFVYRDVIDFVSEVDVYSQRSAGAATNIWMGYLQTYFLLVISPFILVKGLVSKNVLLIGIGVFGCIFMYTINAQRSALLLPIAIISIYMLLNSRIPLFRTSAFQLIALNICLAVLLSLERGTRYVDYALNLFVFRTISLPGLTFSQYNDLFSKFGFTLWSHVKGISLIIAPPPELAWNERWPGLGYIVGEFVYGNPIHNVNANLFSSDGVAAAGSLGILAIGCLLLVWIYLLDRFSRDCDPRFIIPLIFGSAFSLTNGPLFTCLLSFGGLFWLFLFAFCFRIKIGEA
jgi:hypothetical protein